MNALRFNMKSGLKRCGKHPAKVAQLASPYSEESLDNSIPLAAPL